MGAINYAGRSEFSSTITMPSGVNAGDLLLFYGFSPGTPIGVPYGWNLQESTRYTNLGFMALGRKIATGSESGWPIATGTSGTILLIRNAYLDMGIENVIVDYKSSPIQEGGSFTSTTVDSPVKGCLIIHQVLTVAWAANKGWIGSHTNENLTLNHILIDDSGPTYYSRHMSIGIQNYVGASGKFYVGPQSDKTIQVYGSTVTSIKPMPGADFSIQTNVGGVWKTVVVASCNIDGVWKEIEQVVQNIGGVWKQPV